jgi:uncharacterized protein (DUF58 family)
MSQRIYVLLSLLVVISVWVGSELLLFIAILLALLAAATQLWGHYCLTSVTYRRNLGAERLYWGETTDLRVELVNAKPLPLPWLRADDAVPPGLAIDTQQIEERPGGRTLVNVLALRWYERVIRRYRVQGLQRGEWRLGPVQLRSGDLFGFSIRRETLETPQSVIVYPRMVPLQALGLPARHPLGDFRSPRRVIEDPLRTMGVREYVQGDNFRHIHWKATAQRQGLQTKIFEPSASRPLALFLNINTTEHYFQGYDPELREYAITATASLAGQLWAEGHTLGLYCNALVPGTAQHIRIAPRQHPEQLVQMLTALARIAEGWGRWPLERLLQVETPALPYGTTVVVISAVINPLLEQNLLDLGRREFGLVMVGLGEARLSRPLPNLRYHHIGSHEAWHELAALELA